MYRILRMLGVERDKIIPDADLEKDLGLSPFHKGCLINSVECYLHRELPEDVFRFQTIGEFLSFLRNHK
jgi:hypothetical protein